MIRNYLKTALRNLLRNPLYALINIIGLTIGITCSLLILIFIKHEFSFDRFHDKKANLQRIVFETVTPEGRTISPQMTAPVGPAMVEAFPEVVQVYYGLAPGKTVIFLIRKKLTGKKDCFMLIPPFLRCFPSSCLPEIRLPR